MTTAIDGLGLGADRVARLTPLGLRFWDAVDRRFVCDLDLNARARRLGTLAEPTAASVTTSGVYAFHGLPGLREIERGAGDDAFWAANPPAHELHVEVSDRAGRFLPFGMTVRAPIKGVLAWQCAGDAFESPLSPLAASAPIPLMSAPTRAVATPRCSVRAELWDASDAQESRWRPAAWAVLEVHLGGHLLARSFADAEGRVLVLFGFPEIGPEIPIDSPLSAGGPRAPAEFVAELLVRWQPGASTTRAPDLCATLSQAPATLWSDTARTTPLDTTTLRMSEQVLLGSRDPMTGRRSSRLLITPT
jgi:hypothetical protein